MFKKHLTFFIFFLFLSINKFNNMILYSPQFFIFIMVNEIIETFEFRIKNLDNIYIFSFII